MVIKSQYSRVAVCTLDAEEDQCTYVMKEGPLHHCAIALLCIPSYGTGARASRGRGWEGAAAPRVGQCSFLSGSCGKFFRKQPADEEMRKKLYLLNKNMEFILSNKINCQKSRFFSNYWLDESSKAILNETNMYNVNSFCWWHPIWSG